jgi:predicted DNA-binding protein
MDEELLPVSLRLPREVAEAVDAYAKEGHRTRSSAIRELVETALVDVERTRKIAGALRGLRTLAAVAAKFRSGE